MTNEEIVKLLRNIAAALTIKGENRFRIIAYENAATSIEHLTSELKDLWQDSQLRTVPGIGPTIAEYLDELFKTGKIKHFASILKGLSPAIFEFLLIPGIGPKKAYRLTQEFKLHNPKTAVAELKKIAQAGSIAKLEGFGEKSQAEILASIEIYKKGQIKENRMPMPYADLLAQEIISYLKQEKEVLHIDVLGSLRRKVATIGDIDLACSTRNPKAVLDHFVAYSKIRKIVDRGEKGATVLLSIGRQVDLRVQQPDSYGAMLQYFTGSKYHNIRLRDFALRKGLSLSEHGIKTVKTGKIKTFSSEKAFYEYIGIDWMPPEIREDAGEIQAALSHTLPHLVTLKDIKGDVHVHSDYDLSSSHDTGSSSVPELVKTASQLGYEYIGISDHNPKITELSEQQIVSIMKRRREKLEQLYSSIKSSAVKRTKIVYMLEVDINPTGNLALPEAAFAYVDAVIVSIHSTLKMPKDQMTERILKGFSHPKAKILGHPTARLLGEREGLDADWNAIFAFAKKNHKALEINAWSQRLDLPDILVREAIKQGVKLVIDTDSHAAVHLQNMQYGIDVARRGWAEKKDILNTLEYNKFINWLKS